MKHVAIFIFSFVTWCLLSGLFDFFQLALGVLSSLLVTFICGSLLFSSKTKSFSDRFRETLGFPIYALWILSEIFKANWEILKLAFHPQLEKHIQPKIFTIQLDKLNDEFSRYVMGMSITIVAGTVTVKIKENHFTVHAINDLSAAGVPEPMQSYIAKIFERQA